MAGQTMDGLWWIGDKNDLMFRNDISMPKLTGDREVKIKVAYSGVCGSDIHYMGGTMGKMAAKADGLVMGHEFSGTVVEVGKESKFKVGDRVCVNPNYCCGDCDWNSEKMPHFCDKNIAFGVQRNGGWAEYCVAMDDVVYKLPDNVSLQQGALGEPYSCVLRAWKRMEPRPLKNARILIQGAGIIGNLFCTLFHHYGFTNVTVSELHEERRKLSGEMGLGYDAVHPQEIDLMLTGKDVDVHGFHLIIDCTGNTNAVKKAFELARRGAKILIFGCCAAGKTIPLEPYQLFWKELTVLGTFINPYCFDETIDLLGSLAKGGYLQCDKLGVKMFSLDQYKEALETLKSGQASKAMFCVKE